MKKYFLTALMLIVSALTLISACAEKEKDKDYGSLSIADVEILCGNEVVLQPVFSDPDCAEPITYTFEGNNISIDNGKVKGLEAETQTTVTAATEHHTAEFKVTVKTNYGTLTVGDIEITFAQEQLIIPEFSNEEYAEEIEYSFEGSAISINGGLLKGLVPGTQTAVTATTEHHTANFKVAVASLNAVLTDPAGEESKFAIPTPADTDKYVVTCKVNAEMFRANGWTRTSAFAFNGSDNSWYNIEMNEAGAVILYARFNGVEKYNIYLFNINDEDVLKEGVLSYEIALLKNGQATKFFVNDSLVCAFTEDEMTGYGKLGSLEVTACANRADKGEYRTVINDIYYEGEDSETYKKYSASANVPALKFDDFTLEAEDGSERKFSLGDPGLKLGDDYIFGADISVGAYDEALTRLSAFAFNGSDNSWYNIEMNEAGDAILYGRFNGVEKYHIKLFNKNDEGVTIDGKISYTANILKKGQSTYFFINEKLVCSFSEAELTGYGKLCALEITSATDVWRDGGAYSVSYSNVKAENRESENFKRFEALTGQAG